MIGWLLKSSNALAMAFIDRNSASTLKARNNS